MNAKLRSHLVFPAPCRIAIGVAGGMAILFGLNAAKLQQGLTALDISLSPEEQLSLNATAPGAAASREVLNRFGAHVADPITAAVRGAFVSGVHQTYRLALALAVIGNTPINPASR